MYYKEDANIMAVERVLQAFTKRNPSIGYCQGMNFIVARLKKYLTEEVCLYFTNNFGVMTIEYRIPFGCLQ